MNIPYGRQNITDADVDEVVKALKSDFLTQGPAIGVFENNFSKYVDAKYSVAVANGTAALHLAMLALGVQPGQKVIATPITFAASSNSVLYCGGEIEFVDIDLKTGLMDLGLLEEKLKDAPIGTYAGVVPVDFAGNPIDAEKLRRIADQYGLWIVEDACHAPGGFFKDDNNKVIKCGSGVYSDITVFSFHPVKHIACGEGGMITTNNKKLFDKLEMLRTHGITKREDLLTQNHGGWFYEMHELGYNYRITDIQAALGSSQLSRASKGMERRVEISKTYNDAFHSKGIETLDTNREGHAFHLYVVLVNNRKELYDYLRSKKIFAQVHYIPVHLQPYYKNLGWKEGDFPNAENYYNRCLSLPMFPTLTDTEQQYVIDSVLEFIDA